MAVSPSFRNRGISPTSVTTTGFSVKRYSPSFVGNPHCACNESGRSRVRIVAFFKIWGISAAETIPVKTIESFKPRVSINFRLPETSFGSRVLPII